MKIDVSKFRVKPGAKVKLKDLPTKTKSVCGSEDEYKQLMEQHVKQLAKLQEVLYGANKYAVLLVLQGMDTAGKDGVVKHVMSGVNPTGEGDGFLRAKLERVGARLSVALICEAADAADTSHLQPLLLRGGVGGVGTSGVAGEWRGWPTGRVSRTTSGESGTSPLWTWSGTYTGTILGS